MKKVNVYCAHPDKMVIRYKGDKEECKICGALWNNWDEGPKVVIAYYEIEGSNA